MDSSLAITEKPIRGVSFFCTKLHRWRGTLYRILTIGEEGLATYSCDKRVLTNTWEWKDIQNVTADKPGSNLFYLTILNGKHAEPLTFRSPMVAEIVSEARAHLCYDSVKPPQYVFRGSKVYRKRGEDKDIEFYVNGGHLLIRYVNENRSKIIPIYYITDIAYTDTEGIVMLEIYHRKRYYKLKECYGFTSAVVKEMNVCGIEKIVVQQKDFSFGELPSKPANDPNCVYFNVKRLHTPQNFLRSYLTPVETSMEDETGEKSYNLCLTKEELIELIPGDNEDKINYIIPYSSIVGYYYDSNNSTDFYIQFQSEKYLRLLAYSCDNREYLFATLHTILSPSSPLLYQSLFTNSLLLRGTKDHILDIGNLCIHSINHCIDVPSQGLIRRSSSVSMDDSVIKYPSQIGLTFSFDSMLSACQAFILNYRYFSQQVKISVEEKKVLIMRVVSICKSYCELNLVEDIIAQKELSSFLTFLQVLLKDDSSFTSSLLLSLFEELISSCYLIEVPSIQLSLLQFIIELCHISNSFLSSLTSSTNLLDFLSHFIFTSSLPVHCILASQLLNQLIRDQSSLPPPLPSFETLSTIISSSLDSFYSQLLEDSPLQVCIFQVFYHIILFSTSEIREKLQNYSIKTGYLITLLRNSLFTQDSIQQIISRSLLLLISYQNTTIITLLQRIFPHEFSRILHTTCSIQHLQDFLSETPEFSFSRFLQWESLSQMAYPEYALNFPAFFSLFVSDVHSYRLVWSDKQREEVKTACDNEITLWNSQEQKGIWNFNQFVIDYPSFSEELLLCGYFLKQFSLIPISFHCSSLQAVCDGSVSDETPDMKIFNPQVFFLSLYARFLSATSIENRKILLHCMRLVYAVYHDVCGEFFDCEHFLELYKEEEEKDLQFCYLQVIQALCLNDKNKDFFCHHALFFLPCLLDRLLFNHANFNESLCLISIDIIYSLLQQIPLNVYPEAQVVSILSSSQQLLQFVNMLVFPSSQLFNYIIELLTLLFNFSPSILPSLLNTPLFSCILLHYSQWRVSHVKLLKEVMTKNPSLDGVLPKALSYALKKVDENYFIKLFQQDSCTPLLIWNESMRKLLLSVLNLHLTPYITQLKENFTQKYPCLPLPNIAYPELADEIFCCNYYLRELNKHITTTRIHRPDSLLKSIRNECIHEGKRDGKVNGISMSLDKALSMIGVEKNASCEIIYQAVWEKWSSLDQKQQQILLIAEDIATGYKSPASSPIYSRLLLLIQTQIQIYLYYSSKLKSYKYPAFDVAAAQSVLITEGDKLHERQQESITLCLELVKLLYYVCHYSSDNASVFVEKKGILVLSNILQWNDIEIKRQEDHGFEILYFILLILVELSTMIFHHSSLIDNTIITDYLIRYLSYELPIPIKCLITDYFMNMVTESTFVTSLMHTPVNLLNSALPLLFLYNHDEEETKEKKINEECIQLNTMLKQSSRSSSTSDLSLASDTILPALSGQECADKLKESLIVKEASYHDMDSDNNMLAKHVMKMLSTTANHWPTAVSILNSLLTKSLVSLLIEMNINTFLTVLNSSYYASPFIIWSDDMKNQLLTFLESELDLSVSEKNCFIEHSSQFVYKAIQNELIIADVYVRIFNEQNPKDFVKGNKYLSGILQYLNNLSASDEDGNLFAHKEYVNAMLLSIDLLLSNNPSLEAVFQTPSDLFTLFSFLLAEDKKSPTTDLETFSINHIIHSLLILTQSPRISIMIVEAQYINILLNLFYQQPSLYYSDIFAVISSICQYAEGKEYLLLNAHLWLVFLYFTLNSKDETVIKLSNTVLQTWCTREDIHSRLIILLRHFLPDYMIKSLNEGSFIQLVNETTISAEVIWNTQMKNQLISVLNDEFTKYKLAFFDGSQYTLQISIEYEYTKKELIVEGVFIQVYISNMNDNISNPDQFMKELANRLLKYIEKEVNNELKPGSIEEEKKIKEEVKLYESALLKCCSKTPAVLDYFRSSKLLSRFISLWKELYNHRMLHSRFNDVICRVLMKVSEDSNCFTIIVHTDDVLMILLECLHMATSNSIEVSQFIFLLFKKSTEVCNYLTKLNVIPSLIACFEDPIVIKDEEGNVDKKKTNEILNNIKKTLLRIEEFAFMDPEIRNQLESNNWEKYKNIVYS